jgi:hypothetical protein
MMQPLENHQLLLSCSTQWTTSRNLSRGDLIGSSLAFSCSSMGSTYRKKKGREQPSRSLSGLQ